MLLIENEFVELKAKVVDDICKEIIAFANTKGGELYVGIADDGTVVGVEDTDQTILQLNNKIRDSIKPDVTMFVHYDVISENEKQIVVVNVQQGVNRPYYLASKGLKPSGVFVRNGSSSDPATDTSIRLMIKETDGDNFESMRSLEQSLTFDIAYKQFAKQNVLLDSTKMKSLGMVSVDDIYTNVALLLSDQCRHNIKTARFSGLDKSVFQDRHEFSGSLFQQMNDLYNYLDLVNNKVASFDGLYRLDTRDYPEEAIREALLNCLIHRDYSFGSSTLVGIYDDRIEFISIGGLPKGVELDDVMLGLSICRNPKLAGIFYRLQLIEAYGTGLPKIINAYSNYEIKPKIETTNNAFKITLPNRNYKRQDLSELDNQYDNEALIIKFIKDHGFATRSDIDSLLDTSQSTSNRILKQLVDANIIFLEGKGKSTRYKIKKS